ncbi:hypothetical protein F4781DRAFT_436193 [Annulohypoxylon bovei var. microspora]|nr:hypothetical protein F4781DRAFT_436193 [Annulohypoxylon bovei var. microspora]
MARFNRGIAGEKAAVREAQRDAALRLEEAASRKKPSLGELETSLDGTAEAQWPSGKFARNTSFKTPYRKCDKLRADALPLQMEKCLDMAPIKKGSLFFMSLDYVEEVRDWCTFDEELKGATF